VFAGPFVPGNENYGERVGSSVHREKPVLQLEQQTSSSRVERFGRIFVRPRGFRLRMNSFSLRELNVRVVEGDFEFCIRRFTTHRRRPSFSKFVRV
jgi:hypothetical protein